MKEYYEILSNVDLFRGVSLDKFEKLLSCLNAQIASYKKGDIILMEGDKPVFVGIVLSGTVQIIKENYEGTRTIVAHLGQGDLFQEAICCAKVKESPVSVVADTAVVVVKLEASRILHTCSNCCEFHKTLIENMIEIIARKNLFLQSRIEIMRIKSVRQKVLQYLMAFVSEQNKGFITIPFNREEMADYLCVERSALSHELARMKKDGLIDYRKNTFKLLKNNILF